MKIKDNNFVTFEEYIDIYLKLNNKKLLNKNECVSLFLDYIKIVILGENK